MSTLSQGQASRGWEKGAPPKGTPVPAGVCLGQREIPVELSHDRM